MTGFTAVRTTGIYCRPTCSATPLERNRLPFRSAVAAEAAGYRPCLRCRPDRLPLEAPGDAPAVVQQAIALIAEGALDAGTEESLARQVGLTGRHLRRLFNEHVGATPSLVARARRTHFARRLLDETDLRISEIAEAAGYASVRQLNRNVLATFRFTPAELRAKRRARDRLVADGGLPLRIAYRGDLAFPELLRHRAPRAIPGVEVVEGGTYRRTILVCGNPGVVEVSDAGDGQNLLAVMHLPVLGTLIDEVQRCPRRVGLDRPAAGDTQLVLDPLLGPLARARPGVRAPGAWDRFETSMRILLGQQVSVAHASALTGRLAAAFGVPVPGLEGMALSHLFPTADVLADTRPARIRSALGMPEARAVAVHAFARAYADGELRVDPGAAYGEVIERLLALPGIGPWTAEMIAMFAAGQPDAWPAGDLGLQRMAGELSGVGRLGTRELEALAEAWRPHRSLAAMLLWTAGPAVRGG
ncbi:MAG: AlkA N-terminal domain-containing protein [Hyphomicrobiales bacterium]